MPCNLGPPSEVTVAVDTAAPASPSLQCRLRSATTSNGRALGEGAPQADQPQQVLD